VSLESKACGRRPESGSGRRSSFRHHGGRLYGDVIDRQSGCQFSPIGASENSHRRKRARNTIWTCRPQGHLQHRGRAQDRPRVAMKIGVFDSGVGGLTVLGELLSVIPQADYLYVGDTARLPYGSKSAATIARYAVSSVQFLEQQGAEYLVIACNTASALAMQE